MSEGATTMLPLGDRIALAVIKQFDSLKTRGKPQGREWTVLAGLVAQDTRVGAMMCNDLFIGAVE